MELSNIVSLIRVEVLNGIEAYNLYTMSVNPGAGTNLKKANHYACMSAHAAVKQSGPRTTWIGWRQLKLNQVRKIPS